MFDRKSPNHPQTKAVLAHGQEGRFGDCIQRTPNSIALSPSLYSPKSGVELPLNYQFEPQQQRYTCNTLYVRHIKVASAAFITR